MKLIFIGAGMASLVAAYELGKEGYDVTVFEKNSFEELSYDWHDDINVDAFRRYGLPMPTEWFVKRNWTFIPPSERVEVTLELPKDELDLSIERRLLAQQYAKRAAEYADIRFGEKVESLVIEDDKVKGAIVAGKTIYADLVVDNSGAMSPFRASLPKSAGITAMPDAGEIFVAYRAFHKSLDGVAPPKSANRAYLKHLGEEGISWSILDPSGAVNVLIGRVGKLQDETFINAYNALKVSNPQISDEVVRGGIRCIIPIRYPLTRMFTDGYVAIGDSAFMTIPMIGSGIENSMKAAIYLSDVIKDKGITYEALWEYQVRYWLERGAEHTGVDVLKRWLLSARPKDLDWLFERGVISPKDMAAGAMGRLITLSPKELVVKLARGISDLPLLLKLNGVINKSKKAARIARRIPKVYDEKKIAAWEKKIHALFN